MVKHGEPLISVEVSGAGELIAIGSGNPLSEEMYTGNQHKAYQGRLLAILRSTREARRSRSPPRLKESGERAYLKSR